MTKVRTAILDDHPSIIDGYLFRLRDDHDIEVVATANYGNELEAMLNQHAVDVLMLDVSVPLEEGDTTLMPILSVVPNIRAKYPEVAILISSMHNEASLIRAVSEAGVSGYIFKDDRHSIRQLGAVLKTVASGGVYYSKQAQELLVQRNEIRLTVRQLEVLSLFGAYPQLTTNEAAAKLNVSGSTVRNTLSEIYQRLNVPNRSAAIMRARQLKLLQLKEHSPELNVLS